MGAIALLKKYHAYVRPTLFFFLLAIGFDIVAILLGLMNPLLTRVLFDYAYPFKSLSLLNTTVIAIITIYFLYFFLSVVSDYLQTYISQEALAKLTSKIYYSIQCLPLRFYKEKSAGDLLIRITDDVSNTISAVISVLPTFIIDGSRFLIILTIAFFINPTITLLALLSIPLHILETRFYANKLQKVEEELINTESDIYSRAQEKICGIKTIKAFSQESQETLSFRNLIKKRYKVQIKEKTLSILRTFTNSITLQIWGVVIMWYLGFQVVQGRLTIGEIIAIMLYLEQLGEPIEAFANLATSWKTNLVSMKRLQEVLEYPSEFSLESGNKELVIKEGDITTDKLSFSYIPDEKILSNIKIQFAPHSLTAIVGESGGGKTTLANLLFRFFDAGKGAIFIDGQNISEVRIQSLRNKIGIIGQEYSIFDGTILENILYGNPEKTKEDAIEAAKMAAAYDFIERFTNGFDTPVGPGGSFLSGGQKQRIAIARTLLKDPKIIIFDEATSALDPESEFHIQEVVGKLKQTKTIIVIAHRLSTIKVADKILVLEHGKLVEDGTFNELLDKRGAFYHFYWRQFGGLASFRQQLFLEIERAARYNSKFCIVALRYLPYQNLAQKKGSLDADKRINEIDYAIKKSIRTGDNCSVLSGDTILILLPEIDVKQLSSFMNRITEVIVNSAHKHFSLKKEDIILVGTRIEKSKFKTPEELMAALAEKTISLTNRTTILNEQEFRKNE
ncbi:MAG: hypothetical protein COS89_08070 [Deltaproteobacteria bacterium CG07_land_8_20_14_0_80_38_7]|nr:MAG: hypothetical protein COS89_08070 [Deltaproteobacteria bacterium CG07_land_8_20_14_0_80_38_7]